MSAGGLDSCEGGCCYEWLSFPTLGPWTLTGDTCVHTNPAYDDYCGCPDADIIQWLIGDGVNIPPALGPWVVLDECPPCGICSYIWDDDEGVWIGGGDGENCLPDSNCICSYPSVDGTYDGEKCVTNCGFSGSGVCWNIASQVLPESPPCPA